MKRLCALAAGVTISAFIAATVNAAPAVTSGKQNVPQGLKNARKAMHGKLERDKKIQDVRKKGQEKRRQAQGQK